MPRHLALVLVRPVDERLVPVHPVQAQRQESNMILFFNVQRLAVDCYELSLVFVVLHQVVDLWRRWSEARRLGVGAR